MEDLPRDIITEILSHLCDSDRFAGFGAVDKGCRQLSFGCPLAPNHDHDLGLVSIPLSAFLNAAIQMLNGELFFNCHSIESYSPELHAFLLKRLSRKFDEAFASSPFPLGLVNRASLFESKSNPTQTRFPFALLIEVLCMKFPSLTSLRVSHLRKDMAYFGLPQGLENFFKPQPHRHPLLEGFPIRLASLKSFQIDYYDIVFFLKECKELRTLILSSRDCPLDPSDHHTINFWRSRELRCVEDLNLSLKPNESLSFLVFLGSLKTLRAQDASLKLVLSARSPALESIELERLQEPSAEELSALKDLQNRNQLGQPLNYVRTLTVKSTPLHLTNLLLSFMPNNTVLEQLTLDNPNLPPNLERGVEMPEILKFAGSLKRLELKGVDSGFQKQITSFVDDGLLKCRVSILS